MSNPWELTSKERIALVSLWIKTSLETEPPRKKDAIDLVDMVQEASQKKLAERLNCLGRYNENVYDEYWGYFCIEPEDWQALCKELGVK